MYQTPHNNHSARRRLYRYWMGHCQDIPLWNRADRHHQCQQVSPSYQNPQRNPADRSRFRPSCTAIHLWEY